MRQSNQYIYRLKVASQSMLNNGPSPDELDILHKHSAYLEELSRQGVVLFFGRTQTTDESTFGIVVFYADSPEAARSIMENDPTVAAKLMSSTLWPFAVVGGSLLSD